MILKENLERAGWTGSVEEFQKLLRDLLAKDSLSRVKVLTEGGSWVEFARTVRHVTGLPNLKDSVIHPAVVDLD